MLNTEKEKSKTKKNTLFQIMKIIM